MVLRVRCPGSSSSCCCAGSASPRPAGALVRHVLVLRSEKCLERDLGAPPAQVLGVRWGVVVRDSPFAWNGPQEGRIAARPAGFLLPRFSFCEGRSTRREKRARIAHERRIVRPPAPPVRRMRRCAERRRTMRPCGRPGDHKASTCVPRRAHLQSASPADPGPAARSRPFRRPDTSGGEAAQPQDEDRTRRTGRTVQEPRTVTRNGRLAPPAADRLSLSGCPPCGHTPDLSSSDGCPSRASRSGRCGSGL